MSITLRHVSTWYVCITTPVYSGKSAVDDDTHMVTVSTSNHITKNRHNKRARTSKTDRRRHVTIIDALSRPRSMTYGNELVGIVDYPTPERAQEMMEFAKDMEED